ncbi:MAG: glycosyltransferase [Bacteroidales bacterium]|nr:glycosyltransferase [Bacteroidales bacterium]
MITASIVTYDHHLLDFEPVLRSLFASPVDVVYIIDHSEHMSELKAELQEFAEHVLEGEPQLRRKVNAGFKLIYFQHENNGYGGGHNYAIRMAAEAGSQFHLVVNPDVWFGPEVMPELIRYMTLHPEVGQMMPKVLYPNGSTQRVAKLLPTPLDFFGRFFLPEFFFGKRNAKFELRPSGFTMTLDVPFLSGCFMMFRMSALKEVGGFDEDFFLYAEDIDITRRIHARYRTLYYPSIAIYHKFSRASHHSLKLFWFHASSIVKYFNKWGWWSDNERKAWNSRCMKEIAQGGYDAASATKTQSGTASKSAQHPTASATSAPRPSMAKMPATADTRA